MKMKYKIGDKVKIKSLGWYEQNKNTFGDVWGIYQFTRPMSRWCGAFAEITEMNDYCYHIDLDNGCYIWSDDMFEDKINKNNIGKRVIKIDIEQAKNWYKGTNTALKELALQAFTEEELSMKEIKTWNDLRYSGIKRKGFWISNSSDIINMNYYEGSIHNFTENDKNLFIDETHAKSALAMAQISQLMPYYGGKITDEEWHNIETEKYYINMSAFQIITGSAWTSYYFLAFHTEKQRDEFLKHNEQLVKDYFMIEE